MSAVDSPTSVGIVEPKKITFEQPLRLVCGQTLHSHTLVYETYGQLNPAKSNAVLICHALSSNHHAAGFHSIDDKKPGWWENYIGPGKPIDTNKFYVVCPNNIGGCDGSSGPNSLNPKTGKIYGPDFPLVTVKDWVASQALLAEALGITYWAAVIGGSLGGMQAMQWSLDFPDKVRHCVTIASAAKLTAQNIAFNEIARQAITSDPYFYAGRYQDHNTTPKQGLALARMVGHITYLSDDAMREKFGRDLRADEFNYGFDVEFQVESYLRYQGNTFSDSFDANTYLLMTKALDYFDIAKDFDNDLVSAFSHAKCDYLVLSFSSDWRFAPERSKEIADALIIAKKNVSYAEIVASQGHDAFLISIPRYSDIFRAYMNRIDCDLLSAPPAAATAPATATAVADISN